MDGQELSDSVWAGLSSTCRAKRVIWGAVVGTTDYLSKRSSGSPGQGRIGEFCRALSANGTACISASTAGVEAVSGSSFSRN